MNRRNFLRKGTISGLGVTAVGFTSFHAGNKDLPESVNPLINQEIEEVSITTLQQKMGSGETTSAILTKSYLERIEKIDRSGPKLNSVIELNPDALHIAEGLDLERKQGKVRGPLHGIPILIKDNISTGDRMMTTAGSLALLGNIAKNDAFVIKQLRKAGVVLLGKTNLSEWANFRSSRSTSGWSSRGGQTKCPYILDRNPSGSSAGSGSATAANLCVVSVGSETDGSIVSPASVNGLVGIKPTVGLWSRSGIIPISATQDTAGPMARNVSDAALLLGGGAVEDPMDMITAESRGKSKKDYSEFLIPDGLKGKRIGVEKTHLHNANSDLDILLKAAIKILEKQGATIVEVDLFTPLKAIGTSEYQVLLYEFKDGLNKYLMDTQGPIKNLKDLIAFNLANESKAMPYFKQEILIESDGKGDLKSPEYLEAISKTLGYRKTINNLMTENKLDAFSGITNGPACCIDLINGDYDNGPSLSTPAAITGFPHITVPMGMVHGLPIGISFFAGAYSEPLLISMAFSYEQAAMQRQKPGFQIDLL